MFSEEPTLLWQARLCPEKRVPEQLWVLSRGRHSSETHLLLPMESDGMDELEASSVDLFLFRKCLKKGCAVGRAGTEDLLRMNVYEKQMVVL